MGQVGKKMRRWVGGGKVGVNYWCDGCDGMHGITIEGPGAWSFDGDYENPTFEPSQLTTGVRYVRGSRDEVERDAEGKPIKEICHTFIRGGMVQFLGDCTHHLAGQTLPLPDLPQWALDEPG